MIQPGIKDSTKKYQGIIRIYNSTIGLGIYSYQASKIIDGGFVPFTNHHNIINIKIVWGDFKAHNFRDEHHVLLNDQIRDAYAQYLFYNAKTNWGI